MARKIRGIEIEAFRGYDSKQRFSLTAADGRVANLNVLYAPNGFGKTSFIDAVEWALTGQITRFQNSVILNTADRHAGNILHNYDSEQATGTVQIVFEDGSSISRLTKKNRRNRQWDFNEGTLTDEARLLTANGKSNFRIVDTLTQESTDQSVCFTTPEQRFDALRPLWDSNNDTYIYKSLLGMGKIARDRKKELEGDIAERTKSIQNSFKNQGVSTLLNKQLGLLNEVSLYQVESFPEDVSPTLLNRRLELLLKLRNDALSDISLANESLELISSLQSRFDSYAKNSAALTALNNEIIFLNSIILDANKLTSSFEAIEELKEKRSNTIIQIGKLINLENIASDFLHVIASIESSNKNILSINNGIQDNNHQKFIHESFLANNKKQIFDFQAQIDNITNDIESLTSNVSRSILLDKDKKDLNNDILKVRVQIDSHIIIIEKTSALINILKPYLLMDRAFVAGNSSIEYPELVNHFLQIKQNLTELEQKENALKTAEEGVRKLKSLNDTLLNIIHLGNHYVSETQASACPLCATQFNDYAQLFNTINEQNIDLSSTINLDYYRNELDTATISFNDAISIFIKEAKELFNKEELRLLDTRNMLSATENTLHSLQNHVANIDAEFSKIDNFFSEQLTQLNTHSIDATIAALANILGGLKNDLAFLLSEADKNDEAISRIQKDNVLMNTAKNKYEIDISSKSNLPVYSYGFKLLSDANIELEDITKLSTQLESYRKSINEFSDKIDSEELSLNNYFESTQGKTPEQINSEISTLRSNTSYKVKEIELYYADWAKAMNNVDSEPTLAKLAKKSNDINQKLALLNLTSSRLNDLISFVESLKKSIELNSQLLDLQAELKKVISALKELDSARDKSILYIEKKIHKEFNEKLINDIYQKVEPHPTLKEIKFVPELDGDRAKLDILVKNNSKLGNSKAPVVYFSAAQINILSLSIFLAKSLQNDNKVVNTIFMDDPIQFLDSINTLSFIDLIRVITSEKGLNQQVFISTHDESFYKLLKRKIDPEHYASNFMELETFGIIKSL